jgi:23S rRNA pseudouridine2605 synthase
VASRRHAERLVRSGRVTVGGEVVRDPARDVDEGSEVAVDGRRLALEQAEYHLLNKPPGVVSTAHDPEGRPKVTDLVKSAARLYPVGRLDADSAGLLVLTNDGDLAHRLMHPRFEVEKSYRATVRGHVTARALEALRAGVELEDGRTSPAGATVVGRSGRDTVLEVTIHEGRKRQVRRMCEAVGLRVVELERVRYGPLSLRGLARGKSRRLSDDEVRALREA